MIRNQTRIWKSGNIGKTEFHVCQSQKTGENSKTFSDFKSEMDCCLKVKKAHMSCIAFQALAREPASHVWELLNL